MSNDKMSPEMQIAIRRSPDYTAPSAEVLDLQVRLEAANKVALAALERAKKLQAEVDRMQPEFDAIIAANEELRAEVAAWRRAVRWQEVKRGHGVNGIIVRTEAWELLLADAVPTKMLGYVLLCDIGWRGSNGHQGASRLPDRNTACAKVCELLRIPVVLPVGGE
jgi:hypothetical protein